MQKGGRKQRKIKRVNRGGPELQTQECPRFAMEDEAALQFLEKNGYVVFANALTPDEVTQGINLAWDFIEGRTGSQIKRDDPTTWADEGGWPDPYGNGIITDEGAGQSAFQWFLRGIPNVQRAYQRVWNTTELITSFDGICMFRPTEYNAEWTTGSGGYHIDQNGRTKPDKLCVQGFVNFYDAGPSDGGLVVVPRSPSIFNQIFKNPDYGRGGDFVRMKLDVWTNEAAGLAPLKVCAKAGDMVLWDSRTIHCNTPPTTLRPLPQDGSVLPLRRLVAYVCMTPASRLTPDIVQQRVEAFKYGHTSTHWPEECRIAGRMNKSTTTFDPPKLNASQLKLIPLQLDAEDMEGGDGH